MLFKEQPTPQKGFYHFIYFFHAAIISLMWSLGSFLLALTVINILLHHDTKTLSRTFIALVSFSDHDSGCYTASSDANVLTCLPKFWQEVDSTSITVKTLWVWYRLFFIFFFLFSFINYSNVHGFIYGFIQKYTGEMDDFNDNVL